MVHPTQNGWISIQPLFILLEDLDFMGDPIRIKGMIQKGCQATF